MHWRKRAGTVAGVASITALLLAGCGGQQDGEDGWQPGTGQPVVETAPVAREPVSREFHFPGVVRSHRRAALAFLSAGTLAGREVALGERVDQGRLLARLHHPALEPAARAARHRVEELEHRLAHLERETGRLERLHGQSAVSEERLDQVRSERDATRAGLEEARARQQEAEAMSAERELRAPFPGRISRLHAEPGDFVAAGQPVLSLSGDDMREVEVEVPDWLVGGPAAPCPPPAADGAASEECHHPAGILPGAPAQVRFPLADLPAAEARIIEVGLGQRRGGLVPVVVALEPGAAARDGMAAEVALRTSEGEAWLVPLPAVMSGANGRARVLLVRDGKAHAVPVTTEGLVGERARVSGDFEIGDRVITAGHTRLEDGQSVRVRP